MEISKFTPAFSVFIICYAFVCGEKQGLQPHVRCRRGEESTIAPLKLTTLLPIANINPMDANNINNKLNLKIYTTESPKPIKGVIGQGMKQIDTAFTTPCLVLYTTPKPYTTKPMVIIKANTEIARKKSPIVQLKVTEHNDTNNENTKNEIDHVILMKTTAKPNLDAKNTVQTICNEGPTQSHLDQHHIEKAATEKKEETKQTTIHINGKKITEITTTKIIEEGTQNAESDQHIDEKKKRADVLDLTNEQSLITHSGDEKVQDKSVIELNKLCNDTNVNTNIGLKSSDNKSITTNHLDVHCHEMDTDSKTLVTNLIVEKSNNINLEHTGHEIVCDEKNQAPHLLVVKSDGMKHIEMKNDTTDEVKGSNIAQRLQAKVKDTHLAQALNEHLDIKDDRSNVTIKLVVQTPKVDEIKSINVSSTHLNPSDTVTTTKPITIDLKKNIGVNVKLDDNKNESITLAIKELPNLPVIPKANTVMPNLGKIKVETPINTVLKISNTVDYNKTKANKETQPKHLNMERMKMSIKVETKAANKTEPVENKNVFTASVVQHGNINNDTYTKVDIKLDGEKNDTTETITIHRNNVEEIVDRYKYPDTYNFYGSSPYINENTIANNNYMPSIENEENPSTVTSNNNGVINNNNVVDGSYISESYAKYLENYAKNMAYNYYNKYNKIYNPNEYIQGNFYEEQRPGNFYSTTINTSTYNPTYQNAVPSYKQGYQNYETNNAYLNPSTYNLQNYKPNKYKTDDSYYNSYYPSKYNNNLNSNINNHTKLYNYKENYVPGRYYDRIWRSWNNMDITVNNKGAPMKIEFGKDDKNTLQMYNTNKNNKCSIGKHRAV